MTDRATVLTKFVAHSEEGSTSTVRVVYLHTATSVSPVSFHSKHVTILTPLSYIYYYCYDHCFYYIKFWHYSKHVAHYFRRQLTLFRYFVPLPLQYTKIFFLSPLYIRYYVSPKQNKIFCLLPQYIQILSSPTIYSDILSPPQYNQAFCLPPEYIKIFCLSLQYIQILCLPKIKYFVFPHNIFRYFVSPHNILRYYVSQKQNKIFYLPPQYIQIFYILPKIIKIFCLPPQHNQIFCLPSRYIKKCQAHATHKISQNLFTSSPYFIPNAFSFLLSLTT